MLGTGGVPDPGRVPTTRFARRCIRVRGAPSTSSMLSASRECATVRVGARQPGDMSTTLLVSRRQDEASPGGSGSDAACLVAGLRCPCRVGRDVEKDSDDNSDPARTVDAVHWTPGKRVEQDRPGEEQQAEERPDPGRERRVDPRSVEDPKQAESEPGTEKGGGEREAARD
jgi:hypothetical protein